MTELTHLGDAHRGSEQADLHQCHLPGRQTPLHRDGAVAAVKRADRARGANLAEHSVSPRAAAGAGCRDPIGYGSAVVGSAVLRRCGRRLAAALEYEALQGGLELWAGEVSVDRAQFSVLRRGEVLLGRQRPPMPQVVLCGELAAARGELKDPAG